MLFRSTASDDAAKHRRSLKSETSAVSVDGSCKNSNELFGFPTSVGGGGGGGDDEAVDNGDQLNGVVGGGGEDEGLRRRLLRNFCDFDDDGEEELYKNGDREVGGDDEDEDSRLDHLSHSGFHAHPHHHHARGASLSAESGSSSYTNASSATAQSFTQRMTLLAAERDNDNDNDGESFISRYSQMGTVPLLFHQSTQPPKQEEPVGSAFTVTGSSAIAGQSTTPAVSHSTTAKHPFSFPGVEFFPYPTPEFFASRRLDVVATNIHKIGGATEEGSLTAATASARDRREANAQSMQTCAEMENPQQQQSSNKEDGNNNTNNHNSHQPHHGGGSKIFLGGLRFEVIQAGRHVVSWVFEAACGVHLSPNAILIHRRSKQAAAATGHHGSGNAKNGIAPTGCASVFMANEADMATLLSMNQRLFCASDGIYVADSAARMRDLLAAAGRDILDVVDGRIRGPTHPVVVEKANSSGGGGHHSDNHHGSKTRHHSGNDVGITDSNNGIHQNAFHRKKPQSAASSLSDFMCGSGTFLNPGNGYPVNSVFSPTPPPPPYTAVAAASGHSTPASFLSSAGLGFASSSVGGGNGPSLQLPPSPMMQQPQPALSALASGAYSTSSLLPMGLPPVSLMPCGGSGGGNDGGSGGGVGFVPTPPQQQPPYHSGVNNSTNQNGMLVGAASMPGNAAAAAVMLGLLQQQQQQQLCDGDMSSLSVSSSGNSFGSSPGPSFFLLNGSHAGGNPNTNYQNGQASLLPSPAATSSSPSAAATATTTTTTTTAAQPLAESHLTFHVYPGDAALQEAFAQLQSDGARAANPAKNGNHNNNNNNNNSSGSSVGVFLGGLPAEASAEYVSWVLSLTGVRVHPTLIQKLGGQSNTSATEASEERNSANRSDNGSHPNRHPNATPLVKACATAPLAGPEEFACLLAFRDRLLPTRRGVWIGKNANTITTLLLEEPSLADCVPLHMERRTLSQQQQQQQPNPRNGFAQGMHPLTPAVQPPPFPSGAFGALPPFTSLGMLPLPPPPPPPPLPPPPPPYASGSHSQNHSNLK